MKFLCGRPGCGKESTATLQIDAPSTTVSLVDPRISRDGVPLCARHADATTPPMGWSMNDLRSRNRALAAVPDENTAPTSTPPRVRPETATAEEDTNGRMSRRQSIIERARQLEESGTPVKPSEHRFKSSRPIPAGDGAVATGAEANGEAGESDSSGSKPEGPSSRPNRRREVAGVEPEDEDKFPWHFQFDDDEPEELQASSPLLSRAFRATTG